MITRERARSALVSAVAVAVMLATFRPSALDAQGPTLDGVRSGVSRVRIERAAGLPERDTDGEGALAISARLGAGTAGAIIGAFVGAAVFAKLIPDMPCGDDPGLCEALIGYAVGGAVGAAIGTATPVGTSPCPRDKRFRYALVGATAGVVVGLGAGSMNMLIFSPLVSVVGATAAITTCRTARPPTP
ncbi:MAG: hypothetical protein IPJ78_13985 [Gemmatimonadetes bacterium]|nr:hypothetical protein [Gemmatimonadota bacterium]